MTGPRTDPGELRERMVQRLAANTYLAQWEASLALWWSALATVPRHRYIPDTVWIDNHGNGPTLLPVHRDDDPDRWLELAYDDDAVITQIDDGRPAGPGLGGAMPTSSASSPIMVAVMLAALDGAAGHRVLEIGTGTGYNAALLAYRLGAERVTSIEVDPEIAAPARKALSDTGYGEVAVVTGDGSLGHPPGAPYDRIMATAAAQRIPYSWVEQTRPGGKVLLPWANSYSGALVALTVGSNGDASGSIVAESSFMWLRDQRERRGPVAAVVGDDEDRAEVNTTDLHPYWVTGDQGAQFAIGQRVPQCQWRYWPYDGKDGAGVLWLLDPESRSWAKLTHFTPDASDAEFPVRQHGPRRLWDEIAAAHGWWVRQGKPHADRWQFTVTPSGQRIELTAAL
ncbi:MAG: methyltransferase domain-containing protein [Pseudonocardiaceae bacterium]